MRTLGLLSQSEFLTNLGIAETLSEIEGDLENYHARRRAVVELIDPAALGRIKVLAQTRGIDALLQGFATGKD